MIYQDSKVVKNWITDSADWADNIGDSVVVTDALSDSQEVVLMSKADYDKLRQDQIFLHCLEGAGVDNWCGYEDAQEMMEDE